MEITYELPWTHIKKGTVIGLNETPYVQGAGEPLWKILKIDNHGHAEIIPYNTITPAWWINSDPTAASFGTTMKPPNSGGHWQSYKYKNGPNWLPLYWYDTPLCVWSDAAIWENLLANAPYYNCLDVVTIRPQKFYCDYTIFSYLDGTSAVLRELQVTQLTDPAIHTNYYRFWESVDTIRNDYTGVPTFHWRPFTVDDLVSYTNHYHMAVTDYADLYKGGITTIYTDDASGTAVVDKMSYYSLPTPGTSDNWSYANWVKYDPTNNAPMTPVLKIDLSKYHNWHIVKD